jgi:hypothetical protein
MGDRGPSSDEEDVAEGDVVDAMARMRFATLCKENELATTMVVTELEKLHLSSTNRLVVEKIHLRSIVPNSLVC